MIEELSLSFGPLQSSLHAPLGVKDLARGHRGATLGEHVLTDYSKTLLSILAESPPSKFLLFVLKDKSVYVTMKVLNLADCRYS